MEKEDIIKYLGNILIDNINISTDLKKIKLLTEINNYRKIKNKNKDIEMKKLEIYKDKYEKHRVINNNNYDIYVQQREILYNKWLSTKNIKDLYNLLELKKPDYDEIPDIYTYQTNYNKSSDPK